MSDTKINLEQENRNKNEIIPIINPLIFKPKTKDYIEAKEKYKKLLLMEKWRNYINVFKNPYMKIFLYQRQKGVCPVCGEAINSKTVELENTIHHITYNF